VGSACVLRWRPPGAATGDDGGICPKRDADPEPEPEPEARRPGDGAGGGYSEGEKRRWGLAGDDRPSIAGDGGPRTDEPDASVAAR
jgi:hypothetical protein